MNNEIWKPVKDFEERYEVSSCGRVRDITMSKIMNIRKDAYIPLHDQKNKTKKIKIYKIVATAFIPNPQNFNEVKHIDNNMMNNNVENLSWCSKSCLCRTNNKVSKRSTSGIKGVLYHKRDNGWLAKWLDDDGIQRSKTFNCEIYGSEQAKQMAIDCRKQMEEKYNNN